MAPLGTRAIIYEDPETQESWAPRSLNAWLLGPSKDHYRCNLYYVPETRGYRVSAAADLFPQHCIAPSFMPESHVKELSIELQQNLKTMGRKTRTLSVLQHLAIHLDAYVTGQPARHSSECLTTGNMEFPRRTITSHYVVPLLAHIPHVAKHATTSDTSSIACISKRETMRVKDSHYFVYQLDSNT